MEAGSPICVHRKSFQVCDSLLLLRLFGYLELTSSSIIVAIETYNAVTTIPGTTCTNCTAVYDPNKSSTFTYVGRGWTLDYGDGIAASGTFYSETASLAGLVVTNTLFR
jgi:Eukaryotic aspartyl protease